MTYSVNLRELADAFHRWFVDMELERIEQEDLQYLFVRLVNENGSFKKLVLDFNAMENCYLVTVCETAVFILALMEILGMQEIDDFDEDIEFELENWRSK